MADDTVLLRRVRFTADRTQLESMMVPGVGRVSRGDVFEVPADVAERYATLLPTRTGLASDFEIVVDEAPPADEDATPEPVADEAPKHARRRRQAED